MPESLASVAGLCRSGFWRDRIVGDPAPDWRGHGLPTGKLHELFAEASDDGDAGTGAGFAIALALLARATPILWLRTEAAERRGGRLHAHGLVDLGLDPAALLFGIVADEAALLRAAADAARCHGLGLLLVEAWGPSPGLDLTATRRLMLAAEASGVTVIALRIAARPLPSAAETRWSVAAAPSAPLVAGAPGPPRFAVTLLRRRGGPAGATWLVDWNRETRSFDDAPLPGAGLSLAADRAAAERPAASLRLTG